MARPSFSAAIWGRYSESGHRAFVLRKVIGCSMAFHASRKPSTAAERMPGTPSGTPIWKKVRSGPAPSMDAASNSAMGTASNPFAMINTGNVLNTPGRMMAQNVSMMPIASATR